MINGTNVCECLHNITFVTANVTLCFEPFATGPNFGSSDSIGSLIGESEMTLSGMSSDPNNAVNSLDLILTRSGRQSKLLIGQHFELSPHHMLSVRNVNNTV